MPRLPPAPGRPVPGILPTPRLSLSSSTPSSTPTTIPVCGISSRAIGSSSSEPRLCQYFSIRFDAQRLKSTATGFHLRRFRPGRERLGEALQRRFRFDLPVEARLYGGDDERPAGEKQPRASHRRNEPGRRSAAAAMDGMKRASRGLVGIQRLSRSSILGGSGPNSSANRPVFEGNRPRPKVLLRA